MIQDQFNYTIIDSAGATATAVLTVSFQVPFPADQLHAFDDEDATPSNETIDAPAPGVLENDFGIPVQVVSFDAQSQLGNLGVDVLVDPEGSFTYTPSESMLAGLTLGATYVDEFQYTLADAAGQTSTATVFIQFINPIVPDAVIVTGEDTPVDIPVNEGLLVVPGRLADAPPLTLVSADTVSQWGAAVTVNPGAPGHWFVEAIQHAMEKHGYDLMNIIASGPGTQGAATIETSRNPRLFWSDPGAPGHMNPLRRRLCERAADWFSLPRG